MLFNPLVETLSIPPVADTQAFHHRLPHYAATPLLDMDALAQHLNVGKVWVKDESARLGLPSFKILGASWAIYCALAVRGGPDLQAWTTIDQLATLISPLRPLTFAAATDGNHGRAVAYMARILGCAANIFVPAGTAPSRIQALRDEGSAVVIVNGSYDDAVRAASATAAPDCLVICDVAWPGYEEIPQWVIEGYKTIFSEIDTALERTRQPWPDIVVVQAGVGALAAAVVQHFRAQSHQPAPLIIVVEPSNAACLYTSISARQIVSLPGIQDSLMAGLNCGTPSLVAWPWIAHGVDAFVTIDDEYARQAMRVFASVGIVAGETGAAGLAGIMALLDRDDSSILKTRLRLTPAASIMFLVTEGASDPESYQQIVGQ